jgi:hypothetical protein
MELIQLTIAFSIHNEQIYIIAQMRLMTVAWWEKHVVYCDSVNI